MSDLSKRIDNLSPAKRAFLEQRLRGLGHTAPTSQKTKRELAPLVFRAEGEGTPLFLFHYLTPSQVLAKHLGPGRPVLGIDCAFEEEMYLWEESGRLSVSVEELAEGCLAELQLAQPRGPYCLAGFCFGGVLAFEVAHKLARRGERVEFLGLLDSFYLPGINPASVPWLGAQSADERTPDMTEAEKEFSRRVRFMREIVKPYRSDPYPGEAVLFRAMANRDPADFGANGWNEVILGGVQFEDCQSTRMGLFEEPFVSELGSRLAKQLFEVDASSSAAGRLHSSPGPDRTHLDFEKDFVAPRTPVERDLADIWSQVLKVERVGVHDRFFELGGDSILSIQVVAKARKTGLRLTVRQIFQHQTIAEQALVAEAVTQPHFEQGLITGEVPLTPIQKWFFEQAYADQHHWNQAQLLELKHELDPALLEKAIAQLVLHHDALRLRFQHSDAGWTQVNAGAEAAKLTVVDLSGMPDDKQASGLEAAADVLQASLNLSQGPLIGAAMFKLGSGRPPLLLLAIHHLAVDVVSWRILLEDLEASCTQLQSEGTVKLPAKTTSFKKWAQQLAENARSAVFEQEADYWLAVSSAKSAPTPVDFSRGENTEACARTVAVSLSAEATSALLQKVPQAYNTEINDVLLSALSLALASWTGQPAALIHLEGRGREEVLEGIDLSRTVGWFNTMFPVILDVRGAVGPGEVLKSIKEQLRRIPQRGIGYGILRYLRGDEAVASQLRAAPQPDISFNYLGQFDQALTTSPFALLQASLGPVRSPLARRSHLLAINGLVANGQLQMGWSYSHCVHRSSTIECLAQNFMEALRLLIHHCTSPEAGGYTPADFADAGLNQEELDQLICEIAASYDD
jgi:non-ribosomal peptide synthase protein (TIGR01720 family)